MSSFHGSQNQNPKSVYMYACTYVAIRFLFDLRRSFDSIPLKLDKTVVSIENWNCIVFGLIRPIERRAGSCARRINTHYHT